MYFKKAIFSFLCFLLLFLCVSPLTIHAREKKIDSLLALLAKGGPDTVKLKLLAQIGSAHLDLHPDSAVYYHQLAYDLANKGENIMRKISARRNLSWDLYEVGKAEESLQMQKEGIEMCDQAFTSIENRDHPSKKLIDLKATMLTNSGIIHMGLGRSKEAVACYSVALKMFESINDTMGISSSLYGMGGIYFHVADYYNAQQCYQKVADLNSGPGKENYYAAGLIGLGNINNKRGVFPAALKYYLQALEIKRKAGKILDQAKILNNIGVVYHYINDNDRALNEYNEAVKLYEEVGSREGVVSCYVNMGIVCGEKGDHLKAMEYYRKCLTLMKNTNDKFTLANVLGNHAAGFVKLNQLDSAEYYFIRSIAFQREINEVQGLSAQLASLGAVYMKKKNYKKAQECLKEGLALGLKTGSRGVLMNLYGHLSMLDSIQGNHKSALVNYKLHVLYSDSLSGDDAARKLLETQMQFDFSKKQMADSVAHVKEKEVTEAKLSQQDAEINAKKNQQYALFGGLGLVLIFAGFMYNRFKITKQQKTIIEEQKKFVEEKQREVLDSIHYAKRIQQAQMPSEKRVTQMFSKLKKPN